MDKLIDMKNKREFGEYNVYTKKERLMIDREIEKLEKNVGGIVSLKDIPAALFIVDARREKTSIREAKRAGVPVTALIDTNSNPELVDYPIPGNDDAIKSIALIVKVVSDAIDAGYKDFAKNKGKKAEVTPEKVEKETKKSLEEEKAEGEEEKAKEAKEKDTPEKIEEEKDSDKKRNII